MSKLQAIILAVTVEGRTHAEVAATYGVSRSWVTRLVGRYRAEGEAAFEPRSKRPHSSPNRIRVEVIELIIDLRRSLTGQGLDAGPATIAWHLRTHHGVTVSASTIRRHLIGAGLVTPEPRKRPKSSFIRFQAALPNEMWQTDVTYIGLADGRFAEVLGWLDDHSRFCCGLVAHDRVGVATVVTDFNRTAGQHGYPAAGNGGVSR